MDDKERKSVLSVVMLVCSVAVLVLAVLSLTGVWDKAMSAAIPLMGVSTLMSALAQRQAGHQKTFVFCLVSAVLILICGVIVIIIG